jgi:cytochrome c
MANDQFNVSRARIPSRGLFVYMRVLCTAGFLVAVSFAYAGVMKIELPPETGSFKPTPGSELANAQCLTCHSVEYVVIQPPMAKAFWAAEVKKMREKYAASIPDDQIEPLVNYLEDNYGVVTNNPSATAAKPGPAVSAASDVQGFATKFGCLSCHSANAKIVGPAYKDVAAKYRNDPAALEKITQQIHNGGSGKWGPAIMPPFPMVSDEDARSLGTWILGQGAK